MGGAWWEVDMLVCVRVCYMRVLRGAGRRWRCSCVGGVDVGGGSGVGCLAGSPWREAQQSLMISGSERVGGMQREKERQR